MKDFYAHTTIGANPLARLFLNKGAQDKGIPIHKNTKKVPQPTDHTEEQPRKKEFDFLRKEPTVIFKEVNKKADALVGNVAPDPHCSPQGVPVRIIIKVSHYPADPHINEMMLTYCQIKGKRQMGWVQTTRENGKFIKHYNKPSFLIKDHEIKKKQAA